MTLDLVLDARAELGEGPVWHAESERLVFVDILRQHVHVFDPVRAIDRVLEFDRPITALAPTRRRDWIAAAGGGFARIDLDTGSLVPLVDVEPPERRCRMNDGAVDPLGRFWAGSMSLDRVEGQGSLYRVDGVGQATPMVSPVTTSNGPAWSPDGRLMYFVDTRTRRIDVFDFDAASGALANRRPFATFPSGPGRPDGVVVDAEGAVWVALWEGSAVHRYLASGALDRVIALPTPYPTKCAFGGRDLADLFITTARRPVVDAGAGDAASAGGLFRVRPGVVGLPLPLADV